MTKHLISHSLKNTCHRVISSSLFNLILFSISWFPMPEQTIHLALAEGIFLLLRFNISLIKTPHALFLSLSPVSTAAIKSFPLFTTWEVTLAFHVWLQIGLREKKKKLKMQVERERRERKKL